MAPSKCSKARDLPEPMEDHSLLIKPINVGLSGAHHILQSIQNGTAEVRDLLLNECNLIYECRVCTSLHRSLANFLAHKRVYCTVHCCESMALFSQQDIENETVIVQPESPDSGAAINEDDGMCDEPDGTVDAKLEITVQKEVMTSPTKIFHASNGNDKKKQKNASMHASGVIQDNFLNKCTKHLDMRNASRTQVTLKLEPIEDNAVAMLQTVLPSVAVNEAKVSHCENMKSKQVKTQPRPASPVDIAPSSDSGEVKSYSCCKCGSQFSSMKSMSFHLKTIHAKRRVYFHCPYCKARFSQVYGVNRHMMSVHKKSKEQVSRLRSKIQKSALQRQAADKDVVEEKSDSEDKRNNNHSRESAKGAQQKSPIQSSTVRLTKTLPMHRCTKCDKIFMDKRTLESHARRCTSAAENNRHSSRSVHRTCKAKPVPEEKPSDRPRRAVKKKEEGDFVDSSRLNILTNTVASKTENAIKVPPTVERKILEIVNVEKLLCIQCNKFFMNLSNLRRHAAVHIGWNRFKCKHCDYQSYSRSECRSHVKRKHVTRRRQHKQLDSFVEDLPTEEVEKNVSSGDFKPLATVEKSNSKIEAEVHESKPKRASNSSSSFEELERGTKGVAEAVNASALANRRSSVPPPSFNISTRLSPRTFDTSPYRRTDSDSMLVTRSGTYLKTDTRVNSAKKELFALQSDPDNQKVLRTKIIQLKPNPPLPETSNGDNDHNVDSKSPTETQSFSIFSNYDDHNYSVEVKFVDRQEMENGQAEPGMDVEES